MLSLNSTGDIPGIQSNNTPTLVWTKRGQGNLSQLLCPQTTSMNLLLHYSPQLHPIQISLSCLSYFCIYTLKFIFSQNCTNRLRRHPHWASPATPSSSPPQHPQKPGSAPSYQLIPTVNSSLMFLLHCTHSHLQTNSKGSLISLSHSVSCTSQVRLTQHNTKIPLWHKLFAGNTQLGLPKHRVLYLCLWHNKHTANKHTRKEKENTVTPYPLWKQVF